MAKKISKNNPKARAGASVEVAKLGPNGEELMRVKYIPEKGGAVMMWMSKDGSYMEKCS